MILSFIILFKYSIQILFHILLGYIHLIKTMKLLMQAATVTWGEQVTMFTSQQAHLDRQKLHMSLQELEQAMSLFHKVIIWMWKHQ